MKVDWVNAKDKPPVAGRWTVAAIDSREGWPKPVLMAANYADGWKLPDGIRVTHWAKA